LLLKALFILLALARWNLNRFSQFFHRWSHICKLGNLLQK